MKPSRQWIGIAVLAGFVPSLAGCATILRGTGHGIGISSQPPGAEVVIDNQIYGLTPVSAKLRRKDNHRIVVRMEGYEPYEIMLTRQTSGWVFGNILFGLGAPIGLAVDAIAGGMYSLTPDQVSAQLQKSASQAKVENGTLYVVLVPKAELEWEKVGQMQPVDMIAGGEDRD